MSKAKLVTRLFEREGKQNIAETIKATAKAAEDLDIRYVVVFASDSETVLALRKRLPDQRKLLVVTFPHEMTAKGQGGGPVVMGISPEARLEVESMGVFVVQGSMPFRVAPNDNETFAAVRIALGLFGGGAQLCVQAVLMASDAGHINAGERCIAMTADTAMVMRAGHSWHFFQRSSTLAVEHVICKPMYYQISRSRQELEIARYYSRSAIAEPVEENVTPTDLIDEQRRLPSADPPGNEQA